MIEVLMLAALIYYHSPEVAAIVLALVVCRRWRPLADEIARMLELDNYAGLTAYAARLALPAWRDMSSGTPPEERAIVPNAVHVPVRGTALVSAKQPTDRDIIIDAWIVDMAAARDEKGGDLFSANDIFKAVGGTRGIVLARVKELRTGAPPAQFRQDDQTTAPASYPVTKAS